MMRVLSLCDRTGNMVLPWLDAGHSATLVDLQHPAGWTRDGRLERWGGDVRDFVRFAARGAWDVVFAFPPCTHLAGSGARWWRGKGEAKLREALELVGACRWIIADIGTPCWFIENPRGRLSSHWRKPDVTFDPCDFGGYLSPPGDAYTKRTCLWTGPGFVMPTLLRVEPVEGSKMHKLPPSKDRADLRSITPMGFARAVFQANANRPGQLSLRGVA